MIKVVGALLLSLFVFHFAPVKGQVYTKYKDDVGSLNGIIKAYYSVVSVKKGEKISFERDSLLHYPGAKVAALGLDQQGKNVIGLTTLKEYHLKSDAYMEKGGFLERETSRHVDNYRNLYHVWSAYETTDPSSGKMIGKGVNSIELYFDGKRFYILGWFYD